MIKSKLEISVNDLIQKQKREWELARINYFGLEKVESKAFDFDGFKILAQYNPERIRSSAAKTDAKSIARRACFLCQTNRPVEQHGVSFGKDYTVLINPFPIFTGHLTISLNEHLPQEIAPYLTDLLTLSKALPEFTIFYNGPKCGASAPDHFHFQAGSKNQMPLDMETSQVLEKWGEPLFQNEQTSITALGKKYLRNLICMRSTSEMELIHSFEVVLGLMIRRSDESEPMMNILSRYENGQWTVVLFPRQRQRPQQFYAEGTEQILISPASVEMAGLVILPRREDFDKLTQDDLTDIYGQVSIDDHAFEELKYRVKLKL